MPPILGTASPGRRAGAVVLAAAALIASALAGCGGDKSEDDVEALLDRAFSRPVKSADIEVDAQIEVNGVQALDEPVRIVASGPFVGSDDSLPELDVELSFGASDTGQTVKTGFLSTGDRAFVKFGGEHYEQPRASVARANDELRRSSGRGDGGSLRELGLDPRKWVVDAREEGDDEVAGVETEHVSGRLDVRNVVSDLNRLVERSSTALGGAVPGTPRPLSAADVERVAEVVEDPRFDVYVGKRDDTIRRVSAKLEFVVPEAQRAGLGGIEGGRLRLTVELADVNGGQKIAAPADARPIDELRTQLGGLGALGGQPGAGTEPRGPGGTAPAPPPGVTTQGGESPDADALQRYSECLDSAQPDDTRELARCASLLR